MFDTTLVPLHIVGIQQLAYDLRGVPVYFALAEDRCGSTGAEMASRRQQQQLQQFAAVPEQSDVQSWQQPQQMGWPLGARAQQPYPGAAGPVGNVMQAFRGISLQVSSLQISAAADLIGPL